MSKVKKFRICESMHHDSVTYDIEDDASLLTLRNRVIISKDKTVGVGVKNSNVVKAKMLIF